MHTMLNLSRIRQSSKYQTRSALIRVLEKFSNDRHEIRQLPIKTPKRGSKTFLYFSKYLNVFSLTFTSGVVLQYFFPVNNHNFALFP